MRLLQAALKKQTRSGRRSCYKLCTTAAAKDIGMDAAVVAVLSEQDGFHTGKKD